MKMGIKSDDEIIMLVYDITIALFMIELYAIVISTDLEQYMSIYSSISWNLES